MRTEGAQQELSPETALPFSIANPLDSLPLRGGWSRRHRVKNEILLVPVGSPGPPASTLSLPAPLLKPEWGSRGQGLVGTEVPKMLRFEANGQEKVLEMSLMQEGAFILKHRDRTPGGERWLTIHFQVGRGQGQCKSLGILEGRTLTGPGIVGKRPLITA